MAEPDKRAVTMEGWFASSLSAWSSWTRTRLLFAVRLNWGVLLLRTVSIMMLCLRRIDPWVASLQPAW